LSAAVAGVAEVAKETKLWHEKVIRVAAINCGDSFNDEICTKHEIQYYPTLKLFPPHALVTNKERDSTLVKTDKNDALIEKMIAFVGQVNKKPAGWPDLDLYTYVSLFVFYILNGFFFSFFFFLIF
jgi:hypothetical protein